MGIRFIYGACWALSPRCNHWHAELGNVNRESPSLIQHKCVNDGRPKKLKRTHFTHLRVHKEHTQIHGAHNESRRVARGIGAHAVSV